MNWDEIVKDIDTRVFNKTNRHLKEVEGIVLQGAWQGKTYEQMEETCKYSLSYLKQAAGPRLWKLLSQVLEEDIGKSNFRVALERQWNRNPTALAKSQSTELSSRQVNTPRKEDWGEAPEISVLYGRDRELKLFRDWIIRDDSRLVTVFGMGGVGKTAFAVNFAQQTKAQFDYIVWRSPHYVAEAEELIDDLLLFFNRGRRGKSDLHLQQKSNESIDSKISYLIEFLRQHKCLIILDTAAEIWQSGDLAGHYLQQYKGYGELLRRIGAESHQSCLVLCTREKPREVARLEGEKASVRALHLSGLASEAKYIFEAKQLLDSDRWDELIQLYRGNPLALKIVATTITELFNGSVSAFLKQDTIVYGDIYDLLDEQFERLSVSEREIIDWLAIARRPMSLTQLQSNIVLPPDAAESIAALESLLRRSLITKTTVNSETMFSLSQPVVVQYIISRAVDHVCEEVIELNDNHTLSSIEFLRNYALVTGESEFRKLQIHQIVVPIKNRLYKTFRDENAIKTHLHSILRSLENKTPLTVGYARQNIQTLLEQMQLDLNNRPSTLT